MAECYKGYHRETRGMIEDEIAKITEEFDGDMVGEVRGVCAKGEHVFILCHDGRRVTRVNVIKNNGTYGRNLQYQP